MATTLLSSLLGSGGGGTAVSETLTASGTLTVPANKVWYVTIELIGAGGGGANRSSDTATEQAAVQESPGGGGGAWVRISGVYMTAGTYKYIVGAGGSGMGTGNGNGSNGGDTYFELPNVLPNTGVCSTPIGGVLAGGGAGGNDNSTNGAAGGTINYNNPAQRGPLDNEWDDIGVNAASDLQFVTLQGCRGESVSTTPAEDHYFGGSGGAQNGTWTGIGGGGAGPYDDGGAAGNDSTAGGDGGVGAGGGGGVNNLTGGDGGRGEIRINGFEYDAA